MAPNLSPRPSGPLSLSVGGTWHLNTTVYARNSISWNTAVTVSWFEGSYIWGNDITGVCFDLAPTKRTSQWTVALSPPRDREGGDGEEEVEPPNDKAQTTFAHYLKNIFESWDEWDGEHDEDDYMDAEEFCDEYYDEDCWS